jgi:uncharacterized protein (DUF1501 family)
MAVQLTRRQVLAGASVAAASAAGAAVLARHPWDRPRPAPVPAAGRSPGILVLVTLYGGNDGLNTVIPYTASGYAAARPTLGYAAGDVLPLADGLGLHPNLKGLKGLWDSAQLAVVLGVGYPNPVRSHFRSMDIWQSASPETAVSTGWLGRWLDASGTDPMRALSVGTTLPLALTGAKQAGTAISASGLARTGSPRTSALLGGLWAPGPDRQGLAARVAGSGTDLLSVERTLGELLSASAAPATRILPSGGAGTAGPAGAGTTTTTAPGAAGGQAAAVNGLDGQLQLVARLIKAGATTTVYHVSLGGFDTHAAEKANHARLLAQLDEAATGFFAALEGDRRVRGVTLLTYTEFGRRVAQNASGGTDHGTAAPLFVAGPSVKGGRLYGAQPSLTDLDQGDLKYTTDFRSVYSTILGRVIGVDPAVSLGATFPELGFV